VAAGDAQLTNERVQRLQDAQVKLRIILDRLSTRRASSTRWRPAIEDPEISRSSRARTSV